MDNIKQFLEADALRTQGEWTTNDQRPSGWMDNAVYVMCEGGNFVRLYNCFGNPLSNAHFIAAASRIAPDLAKMVDDLRVAKEALESCATTYDMSGYVPEQRYDDELVEAALARLKPYEKLFEREGV